MPPKFTAEIYTQRYNGKLEWCIVENGGRVAQWIDGRGWKNKFDDLSEAEKVAAKMTELAVKENQ